MNTQQWQNLVHAFCQLRGDNPDLLLEDGALEIEGMPAFMMLDDTIETDEESPGWVVIRFEVGAVAVANQLWVYDSLLVANFLTGMARGCIWSKHPINESVICTYSLPVPVLTTAVEFSGALDNLASTTQKIWSKTLAARSDRSEAAHNVMSIYDQHI